MGIRQFGHVKFDGVDLADFGVTLSGTGTYNAPDRDVTSMSVPGRNGDLLFDNGRYMNIEVAYPINIELGLPDKVQALRAFLLSHKGYFRLEDSYHPDEFKLAQYAGPFEITPTGSNNRYGRMELVFDAKPQRFLKAGEQEIELNFTTNPVSVGGTASDAYADLNTYEKAQADSLGYVGKFPLITLAANTSIVYVKDSKKTAWLYPNDHTIFGTDRSYGFNASNNLSAGDTYHTAIDISPFLSIWDATQEIYSPSYFGTKIVNPTKFPALPLIKVYFDDAYAPGYWELKTAFGIDSENYAIYDYSKDPRSDTGWMTGNVYTFDCELFDAYSADVKTNGDPINHNAGTTFEGQIVLPPGESVFRVSNFNASFTHVDRITITPRWWRL